MRRHKRSGSTRLTRSSTFVDYGYVGGTLGYLVGERVFTTFSQPDVGEFGATYAYGINDTGQIVGAFLIDPFGTLHGLVRDGTTCTQLDAPGATATWARGINDGGSIVGYFRDASGVTHGFLATPVPEPRSVLLLGIGLLTLLLRSGPGEAELESLRKSRPRRARATGCTTMAVRSPALHAGRAAGRRSLGGGFARAARCVRSG